MSCGFPTPDYDRLKFRGGFIHAACALAETKAAGLLPRAVVLLKRRINVNKEVRRG